MVAVACAAVLVAVAAAVLAVVGVADTRQRAALAADLAALAAADRALLGPETACESAARVAEANGARLTRCALAADGVADLSVAVSAAGNVPFTVAARSRAGPP
ncbi:Rv3654c family TadE-like protein [Streptomyces lonarensis]|uniref:Rv3654c family TadE-like protein n=1 Tax=Streptomyces lonarensis TaxID=700599 RepID=UPI0030C6C335